MGVGICQRERRRKRFGRFATICGLAALASCSSSHETSRPLSAARITSITFSPPAEEKIARGVGVRMDAGYSIADYTLNPDDYYAMAEVRAADHSVIYTQGCGRGSKHPIEAPDGELSLYCSMRVPVSPDSDNSVQLHVRLYQRTSRNVSVMIASSPPMTYALRNNDLIHRSMSAMTRCEDLQRRSGSVQVCKQ